MTRASDHSENFELVLPNLTRRKFVGAAGATIASTSMLSAAATLPLVNAAAAEAADGNDHKAIVCLFLAGGNDSWNMLVPTDDATYARYAAARTTMALQRVASPNLEPNRGPILPLNALGVETGRSFGVHPAMPEVQQLFDDGALGFVANVGTLVAPIATPAIFKSGAVPLPRALFSHNDQINQWQTAYPQGARGWGWGGSVADILSGAYNDQAKVAMNVSLAGNSRFLTGQQTEQYSIVSSGSVPIRGKSGGATDVEAQRYASVGWDPADSLAFSGQSYANVFEQVYLEKMAQSVGIEREFSAVFDASTVVTPFDDTNRLESSLVAVARTIKARQALGTRRQVFFVQLGGWDHHQELINAHAELLGMVSRALSTFWTVLGEDGVDARDNTVLFTASDFGRTLRSNGRGTDHAWGGNHIVMGGPVIGQQIHGSYPTAAEIGLNEGLDVGSNGRMLPTTSVDEYVGEICQWFGVPNDALTSVLVNSRNFFAADVDRPIGFLEEDDASSLAQFTLSCVANNGLFHVLVVNGGTEPAEFRVEVTGLQPRSKIVAPGEDHRFGISGRPDGDYNIDVYRDGVLLDSQGFEVACDPRVPVVVEHSCLAKNGRVDVYLHNLEGQRATYEIELTGLPARSRVLDPDDRMRVTFTGRPDGPYTVTVRKAGDVTHTESFVVGCDPVQNLPVVVETSCLAGNGRVDVHLLNRGSGAATFEVVVGALAPRTRTLDPGETVRVSITGRPDGDLPVLVRRSGTVIYEESVTIACAP